ncbi:MAG: hypothetical protein MUP85_17975 [Candidatus Lokiarchaeota archaeon]|nr:hypothetical protein [Candidatus Lokiarchaeota archaeon]
MKDKSKIEEKFEKEMGLKNCKFENPKYLSNSKESIEGKCRNSHEDEFNCKITIDSKNDMIIKSECEKKNEKNTISLKN